MTDIPVTLISVVPVLIGPMQALLSLLPAALLAILALGLVALGIWLIVWLIRRGHVAVGVLLLLAGLAVVVILVWSVIAALTMPPVPSLDVIDVEAGAADWSAHHGGPSRRGYVDGSPEPSSGDVAWSFLDAKAGIKCIYSSPAVVGNRVYVTTARWEIFKKDGSLCCLDADTGALAWRYGRGFRATFSSPAVSGRYLVVGEGLHLTNDARVFCFDVAASQTSRTPIELWEYRTGSHVESSPCVGDGRAYVGAGDDGLYCFALAPKADGSANVLWHLPGARPAEGQVIDAAEGKYPDCESSPVYHDGRVYFGLGIGGQAVVCVDAATGRELWRVATPYPVFSAPAVADGRLYVGMGNGDMVNTAEMLRKTPAGEVWCIDLATHHVLWKYNAGRVVLSAVAADGERLYFASRDGVLHCISTDGERLGSWKAGAEILSSPAVGERAVYVSVGGSVFCLNKATLEPEWEAPLGEDNTFCVSSPAVARGRLYIGTNTRGLLCLGASPQQNVPQAESAGRNAVP